MNTTLTSVPPIGQRVIVNDGVGLPRGWSGAYATVVGEYAPGQPYVMFDRDMDRFSGPRPDGLEGSWVITGWDIPLPEIGDKVLPLPDSDGQWFGIPLEYRTLVGTVAETASEDDATGRRWIAAEFPSRQKPDDTIRWSFYYWKPADGHTLTVSQYRPTVGDKVSITGYLSNEGIIDTIAHDGYIRAVDGDIWTIDSPLYGRQVSGPGYITLVRSAAEAEEAEAPRPTDTETNLMEEVENLKRELARANERVEQFRDRAGKWERDFGRYAERVLQEAVDRGWCDQYESVMDDIESTLEIAEIPKREQEFEIEISMEGTVQVTRTVTVTAHSLDDAIEMVNEDMDSYINVEEALAEEARYNGFDDTEVTGVCEA